MFPFLSARAKTFRSLYGFSLILFCTTLGTSTCYFFGLLDSWQEKMTDRFFLQKNPPTGIIIIAIDEGSIDVIGQWPWPRAVFSTLINTLQNARAIGIDVNFSEASRLGTDDDQIFASALATSTVPIILPIEITQKTDPISPIPEFAAHTTQGYVNVAITHDGVARFVESIPPYKTFSEKMSEVILPNAFLPPHQIRIAYFGPEKTFPTFSFKDAVAHRIPPRILRDKIVLVGATAKDLHDTLLTPFGSMPGVEVHANILATILNQSFFTSVGPSYIITIIFLLNICIATVLWYTTKPTVFLSVFGLLFIAVQIVAALLFEAHIVFPNLYPTIGLVGTFGALTAYQYGISAKEKRFLRKTFQYYLAPEVINELVADPSRVSLGGTRKEVTILFSDIRGFTTISEGMQPEQLTHLLNEYLSAMTDLILEERGLLDKYIGDAIMAFWGA
ncbi:MAG: family 3 adenylate cyclase, partial [Parcubacteria group bacterium Gr01-1014_66]